MKYSSYYENDKWQIDMNIMDNDNPLANDIRKAIIGEVHAYNFYQRLAKLAPNEQYRQIILSIQQDEARHIIGLP
jgi:rubrerythrin